MQAIEFFAVYKRTRGEMMKHQPHAAKVAGYKPQSVARLITPSAQKQRSTLYRPIPR